MEVEADAEAMEEATEVEHFAWVADVMSAAGGFVVAEGDVVAVVVFEAVTDVEPFVGEGESGVEEVFELALDGFAEVGEVTVVGEVDGWGDEECVEFGAEFSEIEGAGAVLFFVLDEENGAVVAEEADDVEPVGVIGVFFAAVGDEQVEGAFGEKELVGLVVDFLSAEVPEVDAVGFAVGSLELPFEDVDALGGGIFGFGGEFVGGV